MKFRFTRCILLVAGLLLCQPASAATLNIFSSQPAVKVGDAFSLNVIINTEGVSVNAAQATIQYPKDLVDVVGVDTAGSVFNFWLEGPTFSADTGRIMFTGGSTSGFNGQSLSIATIRLKAKKSGVLDFNFINGAVTASDGSGTSVLTGMRGASLTGSEALAAEVKPGQIVRKPVAAEKAPAVPVVGIPLYPVSANWYNATTPFNAKWNLPLDISAVATVLDQAPRTVPSKSEGLFDNKLFQITKDGTWYIHVRFKNNIGWGETAHYRINVDTVPPVLSDLRAPQGVQTDNPLVQLQYKGSDALSGIDQYRIQVDGEASKNVSDTTATLAALSPGKHTISVQAVDKAGNGAESIIIVETLPIVSPAIIPFVGDAFVGEGKATVRGTTALGTSVHVALRTADGQTIEEGEANPDALGAWVQDFEHPLAKGSYYFEAYSVDQRGAISLPVRSAAFSVDLRPLIVIGSVRISEGWISFVIVLLILIGAALNQLLMWMMGKKRRNRVMIAQRDVMNAFGTTKKELGKMVEETTDRVVLKQVKILGEKLDKTAAYLVEIIEHIR